MILKLALICIGTGLLGFGVVWLIDRIVEEALD